jgi:hypothetical protein
MLPTKFQFIRESSVCENLKLNVGYILFAKNTIVLIIWNTLIFGVFYFLLCPFFWNDWPMEGSVLSFLKAERKGSDTGSAHWASIFTPARFKSRLFFLFLLIYSKPCLRQLPERTLSMSSQSLEIQIIRMKMICIVVWCRRTLKRHLSKKKSYVPWFRDLTC